MTTPTTRTAAIIARSGPRLEHRPGQFGIAVDTREQTPFRFARTVPVAVRKLDSGDYSVIGYEDKIAIERKSENDFVGSIYHDRVRFEEELKRLDQLSYAAVVVESSHERIMKHAYTAPKMPPKLVMWLAAGISVRHVPVFFCGGRRAAAAWTVRILRYWWERQKKREQLALDLGRTAPT